MSKSSTRFWIAAKGNTKLVWTRPEREAASIMDEMGVVYFHDQHTNVEALNRQGKLQHYRFQLDFCIPDFSKPTWVVVLEVNKEELHKRRTDEWESKLMLDAYVENTSYQIDRVINFDAEYFKLKKDRPLAMKALKDAMLSPDRIVWKDA